MRVLEEALRVLFRNRKIFVANRSVKNSTVTERKIESLNDGFAETGF